MQVQKVSNRFFTSLLTRLGILPPFTEGFEFQNRIIPVSIVDQDVTLAVASTPGLFRQPFTTGEQVAPGAGAILADTGALNAGNWLFVMNYDGDNNSAALGMRFGLRDAANASYIWSQYIVCGSATRGGSFRTMAVALQVLLNERVRFEVIDAKGVGTTHQATIFAQQLS